MKKKTLIMINPNFLVRSIFEYPLGLYHGKTLDEACLVGCLLGLVTCHAIIFNAAFAHEVSSMYWGCRGLLSGLSHMT
ncbi:hypothetical protein MANES_08G133811v8 [Manihot esculenta]|uniref:Uncharacterized protein n=1 Tax=Manihot esculenta TaxID=3983 RepID=A0ACB7HD23_MANES|nr:hypothetical protein MANES_08G133811v8 [Manihot esculenta]